MFYIGQVLHHKKRKKITSVDHKNFNKMTRNNHPIHSNLEYAKKTIFKKKLVNGTFVFSLIVGLSVEEFSKKCVANLEYRNIRHLSPVFEGDIINAKTKILHIKKLKNNRLNVRVITFGFNQKKKKVLSLERIARFNQEDI
tara:strand:- start:234 stop:656 length:423 start_codon:yes stop_codon:yes gene_type:complete